MRISKLGMLIVMFVVTLVSVVHAEENDKDVSKWHLLFRTHYTNKKPVFTKVYAWYNPDINMIMFQTDFNKLEDIDKRSDVYKIIGKKATNFMSILSENNSVNWKYEPIQSQFTVLDMQTMLGAEIRLGKLKDGFFDAEKTLSCGRNGKGCYYDFVDPENTRDLLKGKLFDLSFMGTYRTKFFYFGASAPKQASQWYMASWPDLFVSNAKQIMDGFSTLEAKYPDLKKYEKMFVDSRCEATECDKLESIPEDIRKFSDKADRLLCQTGGCYCPMPKATGSTCSQGLAGVLYLPEVDSLARKTLDEKDSIQDVINFMIHQRTVNRKNSSAGYPDTVTLSNGAKEKIASEYEAAQKAYDTAGDVIREKYKTAGVAERLKMHIAVRKANLHLHKVSAPYFEMKIAELEQQVLSCKQRGEIGCESRYSNQKERTSLKNMKRNIPDLEADLKKQEVALATLTPVKIKAEEEKEAIQRRQYKSADIYNAWIEIQERAGKVMDRIGCLESPGNKIRYPDGRLRLHKNENVYLMLLGSCKKTMEQGIEGSGLNCETCAGTFVTGNIQIQTGRGGGVLRAVVTEPDGYIFDYSLSSLKVSTPQSGHYIVYDTSRGEVRVVEVNSHIAENILQSYLTPNERRTYNVNTLYRKIDQLFQKGQLSVDRFSRQFFNPDWLDGELKLLR
jgi:hypothetical protein